MSMEVSAAYRPSLLMVTAVWGDWHIGMLVDINLPTLMAPGNLPALVRDCDVTYLVYTRAEDLSRLRDAPAMRSLRALMPIEFRLLDNEDLANPIAAHNKAWHQGTELASERGMLTLLMPPDTVWSDRAFASVCKKLVGGCRSIFMTYIRVESGSFTRLAYGIRQPGQQVLEISGSALFRMALQTLHPLMAAYLRDSDYFPRHPEMVFWAVPGEGVLLRVLAREMFIFDPVRYKFNRTSLPDAWISPLEGNFIDDSDDLMAVSLAPYGKDLEWHMVPRRADPMEIASWWLAYDSPANDFIASTKIRWHSGPVTPAKWRAIEFCSDLFIRRVAALREILRVLRSARELDCDDVVSLLSSIVEAGRAAWSVRGRGAAIILLPHAAAFVGAVRELASNIIARDDMCALAQLIRHHYVPMREIGVVAEEPLAEAMRKLGGIVTAAGKHQAVCAIGGKLQVGAATVVSGPHSCGIHAIYVIDRLLETSGLSAEADDEAGVVVMDC